MFQILRRGVRLHGPRRLPHPKGVFDVGKGGQSSSTIGIFRVTFSVFKRAFWIKIVYVIWSTLFVCCGCGRLSSCLCGFVVYTYSVWMSVVVGMNTRSLLMATNSHAQTSLCSYHFQFLKFTILSLDHCQSYKNGQNVRTRMFPSTNRIHISCSKMKNMSCSQQVD